MLFFFFFFNDTATTEIYTLSLHDALPISCTAANAWGSSAPTAAANPPCCACSTDRKSTRLNSSHQIISYAVFCLKKKKQQNIHPTSNKSIYIYQTHVHKLTAHF